MKFRHRSGKTGLKSKVKCYYLPRGRLYLPSPSPFRKQCPTFLGSSFSWEWDKRRKCSDSILTPDWQEPKGGLETTQDVTFRVTISDNVLSSRASKWSSLYLCHHKGQHLTQALTEIWSTIKQHYPTVWPSLPFRRLIFAASPPYSLIPQSLLTFSYFLKYLSNGDRVQTLKEYFQQMNKRRPRCGNKREVRDEHQSFRQNMWGAEGWGAGHASLEREPSWPLITG